MKLPRGWGISLISELIEKYKLSVGNDLLDIACGTGGHIAYWRDNYRVSRLDISHAMLAQAICKFPNIEFHEGEMINFVTGREYDALVCLYGSIDFVRTEQDLH